MKVKPYLMGVEQGNNDFYRSAAQTVSQCFQASGIDSRQVAVEGDFSHLAGIGCIGGRDRSLRSDLRPAAAPGSQRSLRHGRRPQPS